MSTDPWADNLAALAAACHDPGTFGLAATLITQTGAMSLHAILHRQREPVFTASGTAIMEPHWTATLLASALTAAPACGDRLMFADGRAFRVGPGPDLADGIWSLTLTPEPA